MKHFFYIVSALALTATATSYAQTTKPTKTARQISMLNGSWYETSYIQDLAITRSPVKSVGKEKLFILMNIDTSAVKNNRLEVDAQTLHEGGGFIIDLKKKAITPNAFVTDIVDTDHKEQGYFYELGYTITQKKGGPADTMLTLYHYNKNKKLVDKIIFGKSIPDKYSGSCLQYMVRKTLIAGTYKGTDSTGKLFEIVFASDGNVTGLAGVQGYDISTDLALGGPNNVDGLCFDIQNDKLQCYAFEISGNTLKLFVVVPIIKSYASKKGALVYTLIKQ